jgi:hypothetical protein
VKTPQAHPTPKGTGVDLGTLYRYETTRGVRYILPGWRKDGSPRKFQITRKQVHEAIDELLDELDQRPPTPVVPGKASNKWADRV